MESLKKGLYPYHLQKVEAFHPSENVKEVCRWIQINPGKINIILFTDEAQFTWNGINQKIVTWTEENSHATVGTNCQQWFVVLTNWWLTYRPLTYFGWDTKRYNLLTVFVGRSSHLLEEIPLQTRTSIFLPNYWRTGEMAILIYRPDTNGLLPLVVYESRIVQNKTMDQTGGNWMNLQLCPSRKKTPNMVRASRDSPKSKWGTFWTPF